MAAALVQSLWSSHGWGVLVTGFRMMSIEKNGREAELLCALGSVQVISHKVNQWTLGHWTAPATPDSSISWLKMTAQAVTNALPIG